MNHDYTQRMLVESRHADLQAEARMARLAREARESRPHEQPVTPLGNVRVRLAVGITALLLSLGLVAGVATAQSSPAAGGPDSGGCFLVTPGKFQC